MMKKLLIVSILLVSSANADLFKALKDAAAKAVEAQQKLNNQNDGNINQSEGSMASSVQSSAPQFNSLAEEAAYKKRQEEERQANDKEKETKYKENILASIKKVRAMRTNYYAKYFVKKTDSKESIEEKYKIRTQLVTAMLNEQKIIRLEVQKLDKMLRNSQYDLSAYYRYREFEEVFPDYQDPEQESYVISYAGNGDVTYIGRRSDYMSSDGESDYTAYLKDAYNDYDARQARLIEIKASQAKQISIEKAQQTKLANEQKERQRVQGECQAWRAKANKGVYSLGVGDQIMSKNGGVYVIQGVNANTFLITVGSLSTYVQKSEYIPYLSIKTAPSQYCYR